MTTIITAENIGKKYIIGHQSNERYSTIRDVIASKFKALGKNKKKGNPEIEEFWALKNINFEINQGDRVGIIGRNGAGKSTLLKVLSRITEPTEGRVKINGRVASLLEVGTGFHPELTGRENIFLNGAILGMSKVEIKRKFDEIVAFSEVEKFLDTPVKRYSSGMYVRLAFAVAAHLEPEILIVDEVLSVGDAQFQKKCLGKMEAVGKEGRTVLFVSHNTQAIERFCNKGILLNKGEIDYFNNDIKYVTNKYLFGTNDKNYSGEWLNTHNEYKNSYFDPLKFYLSDKNGEVINDSVSNNDEIWINVEGNIKELDPALVIGYALYTEDDKLLYMSHQIDANEDKWPQLIQGANKIKSRLPKRFLNVGEYKIKLSGGLFNRTWLFNPHEHSPTIYLSIQGNQSDSPFCTNKRLGFLAPIIEWI